MAKRSTYNGPKPEERLVADLVAMLESADLPPWRKPWHASGGGRHRNLISGHLYSGANPLLLEMGAVMGGHSMPLWVGYGQAKAKGWLPAKGSKGARVLRPQLNKREQTDDNGKPLTDANGDVVVSAWVSFKVVSVFNAGALVGVDDASAETLDRAIREAVGSWPQLSQDRRLERAETALEAWPVPTTFRGERAFYSPGSDAITMPERSRFRDPEAFCATWAHEQAHSTGHQSRLKRDLSGTFGSDNYSREELIAELASVLVCQRLEIGCELQNHAAYLKGWSQTLKTPRDLFSVLSAARAAADLIVPDDGSSATAAEE